MKFIIIFYLFICFFLQTRASDNNQVDDIVKSIFNQYSFAESVRFNCRISYYDTSDKTKPLHSNRVDMIYQKRNFYIESENDFIQFYDGKYLMNIYLKDSLISVLKNDTLMPNFFNISGFINLVNTYQGSLVVLNSDKSRLRIGIKTVDMPSDIITFTVDTAEKKIISYTMLKEYFDANNKIKKVWIKLDYLDEYKYKTNSPMNISEKIYNLGKTSEEIIWTERFKAFKKQLHNIKN